MLIKDIVNYLEERFPRELASDMDNERVGLIIGDSKTEVKNILLALDLTFDVILEAINRHANLVIVHHPFLFRPLRTIPFESTTGKILELMFKEKISLYAIHTALDVGRGGVNDTLARLLELKEVRAIPEKDQFLRCGRIEPLFLRDLAYKVKEIFQLSGVRMVGNPERLIRNVGIVGGGGGHEEDVNLAIASGLDCYITGEISHHAALKALENNLALIEVSHGVEKFVFQSLRADLAEELKMAERVFCSEVNTDPFISI